jgi:hypothetical protein
MRYRTFIATFCVVVTGVVLAGCAGSSSPIAGSPSGEGSALPRDLSGTWHGSYGNLPIGNSYGDLGDCTLRIKDDDTYTVKCERAKIGTNNIARPSSWSGRVVTKGNRVILENGGGPWPSIVLRRSGNGTLYGVTLDPPVGATVEMEFEHESTPSAAPRGN